MPLKRAKVSLSKRSEPRGDKSFLAVADKLFTALETVAMFREQQPTLNDITKRTGLPKSTSFRLLSSLEKCGYLVQDGERGRYNLGPRFFDLANSTLPYHRLIAVARPYLNSLMLTFSESVNLGVLDECMVAHIFAIDSPKPYRVAATIGNRAFLHCTSMGKALAAYLPKESLEEAFRRHGFPQRTSRTLTDMAAVSKELDKVRRTGVSHDNQEDVEGVECFGAPIFAAQPRPIASMSLSGPSVRMGPQAAQMRSGVIETARQISLALGWSPSVTK